MEGPPGTWGARQRAPSADRSARLSRNIIILALAGKRDRLTHW